MAQTDTQPTGGTDVPAADTGIDIHTTAGKLADLRRQMAGLLHKGFVAVIGRRRLPDVVRYLAGMAHRLFEMPPRPTSPPSSPGSTG